jgi:hypothetical protein
MSYYRRSLAPAVWGVVIALAMAAGLVVAYRAAAARVRSSATAAERARMYGELAAYNAAEVAMLWRARMATLRRVDTVFVDKIRRVRVLVPAVPDTIREQVPAVDSALSACEELAAVSDSMRTALAGVDSAQARRDSTHAGALLAARDTTAAVRDSLEHARTAGARRPGWRVAVAGFLAGLVAGASAVVGR